MNLVIVESPTKAKMLSSYLGQGYKVVSSKGHVRDLPKSKLGVDIEHDFTPEYVPLPRQKETVAMLQREAEGAEVLYLATDPDREGESISFHIVEILKSEIRNLKSDVRRVVFHEITKEAILKAFSEPREIDFLLVDAQQARRILDRLVGYKLSPILWKKIRRGLSAGRVQSVAVRFVVEREREITKFTKATYFETKAILLSDNGKEKFEAILKKIDEKPTEEKHTIILFAGDYQYSFGFIDTLEEAAEIVADLKGVDFKVNSFSEDDVKRYPVPPFTTSTLQQEASWRLSYSPKVTMRLAQNLYENGFITYMRTDSTNLAPAAAFKMRDLIDRDFGRNYLPEGPIFYKTKSKGAQEAHEAIRPTRFESLDRQLGEVRGQLGNQEGKLYEIIFRRAVASQMVPAIYRKREAKIEAKGLSGKNYLFGASGRTLKFDGFLKIYDPNGNNEPTIPILTAGETLKSEKIEFSEKQTPPPPRYSEASLIKELEKFGIGRPSTYAPIMSTIQDRYYVEKLEGKLKPTAIGEAVTDFLVGKFEEIVGIPFTAKMEEELDEIANGEKKWVPVIREFYEPFAKDLAEAESSDRVKIATEKTGEKCPKCGADLVFRTGRFGKFISCEKFPECDYKASFKETINMKCPGCSQGEVVIKRTKRRRVFYGCSRYPDCKWASWRKPKVEGEETASGTPGS